MRNGRYVLILAVDRPFTPNLPGVVADGLLHGVCGARGETFLGVPKLAGLTSLIVGRVIEKPWRLAPDEVRWLRLSMGLSGDGLAGTLGVTRSQLSRWEHGAAPTSALADRLLRMVAASFHQVPALDLRRIDGRRAEPLVMRVTLKRGRCRVVASNAEAVARQKGARAAGLEFALYSRAVLWPRRTRRRLA